MILKGVKQGEHSSIVGESADLYSHYGDPYGGSWESWKSIYLKALSNHFWVYQEDIPKEHFILSQGHFISHVQRGFIHNFQKLQGTFIVINRWKAKTII